MPTVVTLKVFRGDELVRTERFTRDIIKIGRLSSAHLCLEDDRISRIHSVIEVGAEGLSIIDMGTAEGTFVNGRRVSKGPLRGGDEIKLGGLRIVVEAAAQPVAEAVNRALDVPGAVAAPAHGNGHAHGNGNGHAPAAPAPAAPVLSVNTAVVTAPQPLVTPQPAAAAPEPVAPARPAPAGGRGAQAAAVAAAPAREVAAPRPRRTAMAVARPVVEEPLPPGAPDHGVELRVLWGDTLLDARTFVAPGSPVLLGEGPRCEFRISAPALPGESFPVLRYEGGAYQFLFLPSMAGGLQEVDGSVRTFGELVKSRAAVRDADAGGYAVTVPPRGVLRAELGNGLRLEARFRRPPRQAVVPWWERLDYRYLWLLLALLFVEGAFVVVANTTTRDVDLVQDDLSKGQQRMAKFVIKPVDLQPKQNPYLEKLKADLKREQPGEMAERHRGEEGQMGRPDAAKTSGRSAPKAIDPNAKELVKNSGLLAALGRGKGPGGLSTVFGEGGLGGDIKGAIGNMHGPVVGDSYGVGGMGLKGTGPGGGGQGNTIGIGAVGTKGRGGGLGGYGTGVGGLGGKRDRDVAISTGETRVLGAIDPELIRKVVRDHADQVRYCYEQQLTLNPKLSGKITIKWIINADGSASDASAVKDATTLESDAVARCISERIVTWPFPKPKGGGTAVVTYPWILRPSGSAASE